MKRLVVLVLPILVAHLAVTSTVSVAQAAPTDCINAFVTAVSNPPTPPDPSQVVEIEGLNVTIHNDVVAAYSVAVASHVQSASLALADCLLPSPGAVIACTNAVVDVIVADLLGDTPVNTVDARYVVVSPTGIQLRGNTLIGDANAVAACVT